MNVDYDFVYLCANERTKMLLHRMNPKVMDFKIRFLINHEKFVIFSDNDNLCVF